MKNNIVLKIDCGILQNQMCNDKLESNYIAHKHAKYFWPVLEAKSVPFEIPEEILNHACNFVFSSKTAIDFFKESIYQKNKLVFKNCQCVYFVGDQSKRHFEKTFPNFSIPLRAPNAFGMQQLIDEYNLKNSSEDLIFWAAESGKSSDIVGATKFKSNVFCVPIYRLIPHQSTFLKNLFTQQNSELSRFHGGINPIHSLLFSCHSGQVLEQAVLFLLEHFSCKMPSNLPENIRFLCVGQSTLDKAKQFGIVPFVSKTTEGERYAQ